MRLRVKVRVGPHPVIHPPAQKRPDRYAARLAEDVPTGHFQACEGADHRRIRALGEARGINAAEHQFDIRGILALHMAGKDVLDHGLHGAYAHGARIDFAEPGDPIVGGHPHDLPMAPAPSGRWRRNSEKLKVRQTHGRPSSQNRITFRRALPALVSAIASLI